MEINTPRYQVKLLSADRNTTWINFTHQKKFMPVCLMVLKNDLQSIEVTAPNNPQFPQLFYENDQATLVPTTRFMHAYLLTYPYGTNVDYLEPNFEGIEFFSNLQFYKDAYDTFIAPIDFNTYSVFLKCVIDNTQDND